MTTGTAEKYGYRIDPRAAFEQSAPQELVSRAAEFPSAFVLWDENDNEQGFLLCADTEGDLEAEFVSHFGLDADERSAQ